MKCFLTLFILLYTTLLHGQDVICVSPFHAKNTSPGSSISAIFRKNHISRDTLVILLNNKILQNLGNSLPETRLVIADTTLLQLLHDSSEVKRLEATTSLDVVNGVAGSRSTPKGKKGTTTDYDGRNMNPGGISLSKAYMQNNNANYFIVFNSFQATMNFEIHFEIYDKNFTKLYGDKFVRESSCSGKMYYSTFIYYFDNYLKAFNDELVKKIKAANTIVNP